MYPQNPLPMPRQNPALIDRLRTTLREVDERLKAQPNYTAAREFRRFLVQAIDDLEGRRLDSAA